MFPQWRRKLHPVQHLLNEIPPTFGKIGQAVKRFEKAVRWSAAGLDDGKVERLKDVVASGRQLADVMNTEGWGHVLDAKLYYQSLYDRRTKNPSLSEKERFQAACEWAAIEGFFAELSMRVRRGQQAQKHLKDLVR